MAPICRSNSTNKTAKIDALLCVSYECHDDRRHSHHSSAHPNFADSFLLASINKQRIVVLAVAFAAQVLTFILDFDSLSELHWSNCRDKIARWDVEKTTCLTNSILLQLLNRGNYQLYDIFAQHRVTSNNIYNQFNCGAEQLQR